MPRLKGGSRFASLLRTSMPSFDGLPNQSRRSLRLAHAHAITPTFDAHHDAPMVEAPVPLKDAHLGVFMGGSWAGWLGGSAMANASFACHGTHAVAS